MIFKKKNRFKIFSLLFTSTLITASLITLASCSFNTVPSYPEMNKDNVISFKGNKFGYGKNTQFPSAVTIDDLKQLVLNNKDQIFNQKKIKDFDWEKNIVISDLRPDDDLGELIFTCTLHNTANGTITNNLNFFNYKMRLSANGGTHNELNVNSFLAIVKNLNIDKNTILSTLDNNVLNNQLHQNNDYRNMNLSILNGSSETDGVLKLLLTGSHDGINYNNEIIISGFNNNVNNFNVDGISLDLDYWFNNNQKIVGTSLNIDNKLEAIKNANFSFNNQRLTLEQMKQKYIFSSLSIIEQNNTLTFRNIQFKTRFKEYSNNQWVETQNQKIIEQNSNSQPKVPLPKINDLMRYMIDKMEFDITKFANQYSSYYGGLFAMSIANPKNMLDQTGLMHIIDKDDKVINKYKNTYFPDRKIYLKLDLSNGSLTYDDYQGTLSFNTILVDEKTPNNLTTTRAFSANNFKRIDNFLNQQKNIVNQIELKPLGTDSKIANKTAEIFKDAIKDVFNSSSNDAKEVRAPTDFREFLKNYSYIFNIDNQAKNENNARVIEKNYSLSLFNQKIDKDNFDKLEGRFDQVTGSALDFDTGLFRYINDNEIFMISNINFDFSNINSVWIKKEQDQSINITFDSEIKYTISNQIFSQPTKFTLVIKSNNSDINYWLNQLVLEINAIFHKNYVLQIVDNQIINEDFLLKKVTENVNINSLFSVAVKNVVKNDVNKSIQFELDIYKKSDNSLLSTIPLHIQYKLIPESEILTGLDKNNDVLSQTLSDPSLRFTFRENVHYPLNNKVLKSYIESYVDEYLQMNTGADWDPNFDFDVISFSEDLTDQLNFKVKYKVKLYSIIANNIFKETEFETSFDIEYDPSSKPDNIPLNDILNDVKLVPFIDQNTKKPKYQELYAYEFYNLDPFSIKNYFDINYEELVNKYTKRIIDELSFSYVHTGRYDPNKPKEVKMKIAVQNPGVDLVDKIVVIDDFRA